MRKALEALAVVGMVLGALVVFAGFLALPGVLTMLGWNYVAVPLFDAPPVTFLQAWVIWLVAGLLLKGRSVVTVRVKKDAGR